MIVGLEERMRTVGIVDVLELDIDCAYGSQFGKHNKLQGREVFRLMFVNKCSGMIR